MIVLSIMVVSTLSLLKATGGLDDPDVGRAVLRLLERNQFLNNALVILWIFIMALMFRWKRSWEKKISSKIKGKPTVAPTVVAPSTIDNELERLKTQIEEEKK